MIKKFERNDLNNLYKPANSSTKNENGLVTIIAGSKLFHGPPLVTIQVASRIVDMVFLSSPEPSIGRIAENLKSQLSSFIWIPWEDTDHYIEKSDSLLIGPGFMRYGSEKDAHLQTDRHCDETCMISREITRRFLKKYYYKRWVIDGGSLQVMDPEWIPSGAVLTPNLKEYKKLFSNLSPESVSKKYDCTIVVKGPISHVYSPGEITEIRGGNPGLTKGATGDVQAGLTCALFAKNSGHLSASAASYIIKSAAESLYHKVGVNYNADDLVNEIPQIMR